MEPEVPSKMNNGKGLINPGKLDLLERGLHVDLERFQTREMKTTEDIYRVTPANLETTQMRQSYALISSRRLLVVKRTGDAYPLETRVVREQVEQSVGGGRSGIVEVKFGKVPKYG